MFESDRSFEPALPCRPRTCLSSTLQAKLFQRDYTVSTFRFRFHLSCGLEVPVRQLVSHLLSHLLAW
jgi:hypothetical protein